MKEEKKVSLESRVCKTCAGFAVFALLLTHAAAQTQGYTVTDFGSLGGNYSQSEGVNNLGQVVGSADIEGGVNARHHAFLGGNGTLTDLMIPHRDSEAHGINDAGQIAVHASDTDPPGEFAYIWDAGTLTPLIPFPFQPPAGNCNPRAINGGGNAVGNCSAVGIGIRATYWSGPGAIGRDLGSLIPGGVSDAWAINNFGQIVGESSAPDAIRHAFLADDSGMQDLGTLPGFEQSYAYGINDLGQVVGFAGNGVAQAHAFLFDNGVMQDLGSLPGYGNSVAYGINTAGQVVGVASAGFQALAVLWENGIPKQLGTLVAPGSGWDQLGAARAINDAGQIVVTGTSSGHPILLTPLTPASLSFDPNPVRGGSGSTGVVSLTGKTPPAGVVVKLKSSDPIAQPPDSVTVAPGQTSATFPIATTGVTADTAVDVTATVNGVDYVASLLVTAQ